MRPRVRRLLGRGELRDWATGAGRLDPLVVADDLHRQRGRHRGSGAAVLDQDDHGDLGRLGRREGGEPGVVLRGDVTIENPEKTVQTVKAGVYENASVRF